jgi:stage V sporulation protein T
MSDVGIIRRIDDLGRVVIPKELRKKLKISEGDPLELIITDNGDLLVKKYNSIISKKHNEIIRDLVLSGVKALGIQICIVNHDFIFEFKGDEQKERFLKGYQISQDLKEIFDEFKDLPRDILKTYKQIPLTNHSEVFNKVFIKAIYYQESIMGLLIAVPFEDKEPPQQDIVDKILSTMSNTLSDMENL